MHDGKLTQQEAMIIHQLLAKHGITQYEVVGAVEEGKTLPGSRGPRDIELLSGTVVTSTTAYSFWLDWVDGDYTLGEQSGEWRELAPGNIASDFEIRAAQQRLREKGASTL
ncbi:MAG TPA: hypothetical protein VFA09_14815 [Ktedonobacteraceae bacterium]|jgi:hypothetical protein|nr:hypothetical protein [Ktedonobacteraceae bacterium]